MAIREQAVRAKLSVIERPLRVHILFLPILGFAKRPIGNRRLNANGRERTRPKREPKSCAGQRSRRVLGPAR